MSLTKDYGTAKTIHGICSSCRASSTPVPLLAICGDWAYAAERPNIVFLFSDDQTLPAVGCYGNQDVATC